eukprot:3941783-Rhodomonas_salina.1
MPGTKAPPDVSTKAAKPHTRQHACRGWGRRDTEHGMKRQMTDCSMHSMDCSMHSMFCSPWTDSMHSVF